MTPPMTLLRSALLGLTALTVSTAPALAAPPAPRVGEETPAAFKTLDRKVARAATRLDALIRRAEAQGIPTDYARVSAEVLAAFQVAARHDHANMDTVRKSFAGFRFYKKIDPAMTERVAHEQLRDCLDVAAHASDELRRQLGGRLTLPPTPDLAHGRLALNPAEPYYRLDGRIVFPSSLVWMPPTPEMIDTFGRIGGTYIQPRDLRPDGTVSPAARRKLAGQLADHHAQGMAPLVVFIGHHAADWMKKKHPEILKGGRNFVTYDIDSPLVRGWIDRLYDGLYPALSEAAGDAPQVHLLANEPHFATRRDGWRVNRGGFSELIRPKYRAWLAEKYGTVEAVNAAHGTAYAALDAVEIDLPIDPALRGGPVWYDWCRFNMDRVNDWFAFQKEVAHKHDPNRAPVTIKVLGHTLGDTSRDQGMDIEFLVNLQDIGGADLRAAPRTAEFHGKHEGGLDPKTGWRAHFAYDWADQLTYLDFSKSLAPDKPFYDSEWHGLSAVSWRDFDLDRDYVRSAVWSSFTHGMALFKPWVWGRNEEGAFRDEGEFFGELSTQPVAADALGRVLKELNAVAPRVAALVPRERNFMVYYCEEAAIQNGAYPAGFAAVYEALKLLNVTVGFATPTSIAGLDPGRQVVVLPPTPHVTDASRDALRAFRAAGGRVVAVDADASFHKTELGADRPAGDRVRADIQLAAMPALALADALGPAVEPLVWPSPVNVAVADPRGEPAYGVLVQQTRDPASGRVTAVLNNVSRHARTATLTPATGWTDLLTGRAYDGPLQLKPCDVRLLERDAE